MRVRDRDADQDRTEADADADQEAGGSDEEAGHHHTHRVAHQMAISRVTRPVAARMVSMAPLLIAAPVVVVEPEGAEKACGLAQIPL
jgi:hypothetical protein